MDNRTHLKHSAVVLQNLLLHLHQLRHHLMEGEELRGHFLFLYTTSTSGFHTSPNKLSCEVRPYVLFTEQLEIVSLRRAAHSPLRLQHVQLTDRVSGGAPLHHRTGVDAQLLHPTVTDSVSVHRSQCVTAFRIQ